MKKKYRLEEIAEHLAKYGSDLESIDLYVQDKLNNNNIFWGSLIITIAVICLIERFL